MKRKGESGGDPRQAVKKLREKLRSDLYSYLVLSLLENEGELHGYVVRKKLGGAERWKARPE